MTVWVGSKRYTFPAGRDVTVGRDTRSDIHLDGMEPTTSPTHLVLHHDGRQWVALDRSQHGIYVDGVRMSTVFIRDGRAITLGDPRHGPKLVFQLATPAPPPPRRGAPVPQAGPPPRGRPMPPPPPPKRPVPPRMPASPGPPPRVQPPPADQPKSPPSQAPTQRFRLPRPRQEPARPPAPEPRPAAPTPPSQLPTTRFQAPPTPAPPPPAPPPPPPPQAPPPPPAAHPKPPEPQLESQPSRPQTAQRKGQDLVGRMTGAMQRLIPNRPAPRPHETAPTSRLPRAEVAGTGGPSRPAPKLGALHARRLTLGIEGQPVLSEVSFTAAPGTLTAIVGPSPAAGSALIDLLGGAVRPTDGTVTVGGHDVHGEYGTMRPYIGIVPQADLVHPQLTVEQALGYVAELRLPPSTSGDDRRKIVDRVIAEVGLNSRRTIQVGRLAIEQRKRASLASELITEPSLLVLDEPTAGLDPEGQQQIVAVLRRLADAGRVVVMSTTAVDHVGVCDQVLLLTSAGTVAFVGPPAQIDAGWPEILAQVTSDPDGAHQKFLARGQEPPAAAETVEPLGPPEHLGVWRQIVVAARRQAWLLVGDQRYLIFLTILPALFGALALVVPGHAGLGRADPYGDSPDEAVEILVVLNLAAVVMGTALAIRDLFRERCIFQREQADGLSTSAYLAAKVIVYGLVALVQTAVITTAAVAGKGAPVKGAVLLGSSAFELYVSLAATAIVSVIVALVLSSLARYAEQLVLMTVVLILLSLLFSGGAFPLAGRFGLEQLAWLVPSRWGFAAAASTVDVHAINLLASYDESWTHSAGWWLLDMAILIGFGVVGAVLVRWRLRRVETTVTPPSR
ncbi:ATP-binding cassette domain-containing protein [Mycobacterium celatum]|nr:ATP-binding cassette domain-containing protein [Mycobacterium celatum]